MDAILEDLVIIEETIPQLPKDRVIRILRMVSKLRSELDQVEHLLEDLLDPEKPNTAPDIKHKGGRSADLDYDQAFDQIYIAGKAFQEVFKKWMVAHPDKTLYQRDPYECFTQAMKRRLEKIR